MNHQTDIKRLERNLRLVAKAVKIHGATYLPTFERLESELANAQKIQASLERALQYCDADD